MHNEVMVCIMKSVGVNVTFSIVLQGSNYSGDLLNHRMREFTAFLFNYMNDMNIKVMWHFKKRGPILRYVDKLIKSNS